MMRKWKMPHNMQSGALLVDLLPPTLIELLRTRVAAVLLRNAVPEEVTLRVTGALIDAVSYAFVGRNLALVSAGAGRPLSASANVLSIDVRDILKQAGIRGCWGMLGDEEEDGRIGIVTELEGIAQTALRVASGGGTAVMARTARITESRRRLGKIFRE